MGNPAFKIYNASAGSGKTFTLVKEYLKVLLTSSKGMPFKHVLAITFTNKAVGEMKQRIIENLKKLASDEILSQPSDMFDVLIKETGLTPAALQHKAASLLKSILHNYAFFDVSTIDRFMHRIVRTFAYDLRLPLSFEVELDTDLLLGQAVDALVAKAGQDPKLTKLLLDFAFEKADDDKSWDVTIDLNKAAKLLTNENELRHIEKLKQRTLEDFSSLRRLLAERIKQKETLVLEKATAVLALLASNGLETSDFTRGTLPNHFKKVAALDLTKLYQNKLQQNIEEGNVYNKSLDSGKASTIDGLLPEILASYLYIKEEVTSIGFLKNFYKNITPLSVLSAIHQELKQLQEEQYVLPISDFNTIIAEAIKDQPAPFIYERLGEKFRHYFIDEFQDTSLMQWSNLVPLIANALESESLDGKTGSLLLVGDPKQAIYRWRGGKAEQFIGLTLGYHPFSTAAPEIDNLPINFRSHEAIVHFNNDFFNFMAQKLSDPVHSDIYLLGSQQEANTKKGGYVNLEFVQAKNAEERDEIYPEHVLKNISDCLERGFDYGDVCVLTRKKREGIVIADYLLSHNIPIVSSETLLLKNTPVVQFLNHLLKLSLHPRDNETKIAILAFLYRHLEIKQDQHSFYKMLLAHPTESMFEHLNSYGVHLDFNEFSQLPLYEAIENAVKDCKLSNIPNAYIQFYLDIVLDFSQKHITGIQGFLEYWEKKKDTLSIVAPQGGNAVEIMTIHKAKGLEFPVVIFPYANLNIYKEIEAKTWFPLDKTEYLGFEEAYLSYSDKTVSEYGSVGAQIATERNAQLELDNINLLYVALTRAVEHLYVISETEKIQDAPKTYAGFLIQYLIEKGQWSDETFSYDIYGTPKKVSEKRQEKQLTVPSKSFICGARKAHQIQMITKQALLWDTVQEKAIAQGNLVHDIMAKVIYNTDIDMVFETLLQAGGIDQNEEASLRQLVTLITEHPLLRELYEDKGQEVYAERDIFNKGNIIRPDRVNVMPNGETTIIDYKTGERSTSHHQQLISYQDVLIEMGFHVAKKFLVYVDQEITVETV